MSVPESNITTTGGDGGTSKAQAVAGTAKEQAASVGSDVSAGAKAVAGQASDQARLAANQAKDQATRLARQTKDELLAQADTKGQQAASGLRTISGQLGAIAAGRPEEAGPLGDYARQASGRAAAMAQRIETGGVQGVMDDVTGFARRRPGLFLLAAVGAGFLAGRMVRSGKAAMDDQGSTPSTTPRVQELPPPSVVSFEMPSPTASPAYAPATEVAELP
jgi:hypothetical protein